MKKIFFALGLFIAAISFVGCSDDDDDTAIAYKDLPAKSQVFLETHFPSINATSITKERDGYDVKLTNMFEIDFDLEGEWDDVDGKYQKLPDSFLATLPQPILTYVSTTYPNLFIVEIDKDPVKNGYEVGLNNDLDLIFEWDGTFRTIDR